MNNILSEREKNNIEAFCRTALKYNPNAISVSGIHKLVGKNIISMEAAANMIDLIERGKKNEKIYSVENIENKNIVEPEKMHGLDEKIKNLANNPSNIMADTIVEMVKVNDNLLYKDYKEAINVYNGITAQMVSSAAGDFTSMMSHIDTLLDEGDKDSELFEKIKKTNIKIK